MSRAGKFLKQIAVFVCAAAGVLALPAVSYGAEGAMTASYGVYQYGKGWSGETEDNTCYQVPADSYVTGMRATLTNQPAGMTGTISYQVNLSGSGWLGWEENFAQTGTTSTNMPLEALKVKLTGQLEENYDVYYSVFQDGVWTELVMNGQVAGSAGVGKRIDGVRIAVTAKGAVPGEPKMSPAGRVIDSTKPMVALTFDDGPSAHTARILDSLEAHGGRATFFMVGNRIGSYKSTVKRMVELGCEPGSHTYDHTKLTTLSENGIISNLNQADEALMAVAGVKAPVMRPPGGFLNETERRALARKGVPAIMWSVDTLDWKTRNAGKTVDTVLNTVKDGDIILMHDLYESSAEAAEILIPELTKRGYQLVTVSEMASYRGGMTAGKTYNKFRP